MGMQASLSRKNCTMQQRFKKIARQHAVLPAIQMADKQVDYVTLDRMSDAAAAQFLKAGVSTGDVVAIFAEKSFATYASMVAALKIGAPYVVLDTQSPKERLHKILDCCKPKLIVAQGDFSWKDTARLALEVLGQAQGALPENAPQPAEDTPAYIMFTSGSTGTPKGVMVSHASMVNFCDWSKSQFVITPQDKITGVNALYFDNSVFDFTASLFNGACLVPVTRDVVSNPKALVEAVKDCSIWFSVPSLLIYVRVLKALEKKNWPTMRSIIFGGEGFPKNELKKLYDLYGAQAKLWNVYGPTECTCICSAYEVIEADFVDMEKLAPLGHLAENFSGMVMDEAGKKEVAAGKTGELFLMGSQVALGYCNDAAKTAQAFAPNPAQPLVPCYRTGDLVYQDEAGQYHFAGRKDNQIKHMGYRIELEEIEAALAALEGVAQSGVIYQKKPGYGGHIIACVQAAGLDVETIKEELRQKIPAYMVPELVHLCESLPKNANGKVDRKALAAKYVKGDVGGQ